MEYYCVLFRGLEIIANTTKIKESSCSAQAGYPLNLQNQNNKTQSRGFGKIEHIAKPNSCTTPRYTT
jgi:hypothetical protein